MLRQIRSNPFIRNVGLLTFGTLFAQGLMVAVLPILTRLYTPDDFSLLAIYTSVIGLVTVAACLRFNIAIPLPDDDRVALRLFWLGIGAALAFTAVLALLVLVWPSVVVRALGQPAMAPFLWMIPLGVFLAATYDALQYWASRRKRFGLITVTRVTRAVGGASTQLGVGAATPGPFGLLFGQMLYSGLGLLGLSKLLYNDAKLARGAISANSLQETARTYWRWPVFSVPESIFNTAGTEVPILIVAAWALGPEAGFLMLAMRVMGLPMGLVGSSVSQVYLAEAPAKLRDGTIGPFTRKTMTTLFRLGAPVLGLAALVSPFAFPIVFGAEWERAGIIVAWSAPWFLLQFVVSPVSMLLHISNRLMLAMVLQAAGAVLRIGTVLVFALYWPERIVESFALVSALFYAIYALVVMAILKRDHA